MKVPKYVQELMARSQYEYVNAKGEHYAAGYTLRIEKRSPYTQADTFRREIERLVRWANRTPAGPDTAYILYTPQDTRHCTQYALITIFDPVMQRVEKYIPQK